MNLSAYVTNTRGAHHKDHDCVEDTLGLRFQEATIRGILYAQHDCVEDALDLRFYKPPSANPLCMRIVLLVESSWILRSCGPATTNSLRCQAKVSIITSNVPHSVH